MIPDEYFCFQEGFAVDKSTWLSVRQTRGGSGYNNAILLWSITRILDPILIIESGMFRGFTSWVLRQAAPRAEQYAFDISLDKLQYRAEGVKYYEHDWFIED
ncbi:MAG: hypothetical protein AAGB13_16640, partial [Cyanobacteria bacterium P01_F01_bin.33]